MKTDHLNKILGKIENLDPSTLAILAKRLARERRLLEAIFNIIQEGILIIDSEGVIQYSNPSANQLISLNEKDLGTAILWKHVPPLKNILHLPPSPPPAVTTHEIHLTYPENRFVRLYTVPLHEEDEDHRFVIILRDITEEKFKTEEMIETEKISSLFMLAAGVAHELGNPLNSINIHLQLIKRLLNKVTPPTPEFIKINDSVDACVNEVNRLDGIIQNFLKAIKPLPPDFHESNILELLQEVLFLQHHEMHNLGIHVELDLPPTLPPPILLDRNQIKQVFFNIIKNATQAMGKNGLLKIQTQLDDEFLNMHFLDNGIGIEEKHLSKIFDPYYSTKQDGSGLGLMIVQRIMRTHGGQVTIQSTQGQGTQVTLRFPLQFKRIRMLETTAPT